MYNKRKEVAYMQKKNILTHTDHTLLKQVATWKQIEKVCEEAVKYQMASVCIPPCYVKQAAEFLQGRVPVCTVIGFPNGYQTTAVKVFETKDAIANGAEEIDMVINIGWAKAEKWDDIEAEINAVKAACGNHILKVIIETCLLTEGEKIMLCEVVNSSDAEYIKTSTGFGGAGATAEDVELFEKYMKDGKKIKAAGGIQDIDTAELFLKLGADRLGSSSLVKICEKTD